MGSVLAQGERRWYAEPPELLDRGPQRHYEGGEILRVEPGAGRAGHESAALVANRFRTVVGGKLLSPSQRGVGARPLRGSRLALCASPFLPDATEPLVLRSRPAEIRRCDCSRGSAGAPDDGTSPAGHQHLAARGGSPPDDDRTPEKGVGQTALLPKAKRPGPAFAHENEKDSVESPRHQRRPHQVLPSSTWRLSRNLCCYGH